MQITKFPFYVKVIQNKDIQIVHYCRGFKDLDFATWFYNELFNILYNIGIIQQGYAIVLTREEMLE